MMIDQAGVSPANDKPALTGLRGIAALLVATYHYFLPFLEPGSIPYRLFGRGYLYVDLFFVLSGYVLMLNYGKMFVDGTSSATLKLFFWKRFARVYPLYFVVLAAMTVGYWMKYGDFTDHGGWMVIALPHPMLDFPLNVALMQSWGLAKGIVGQAWSVSTETMAYLLFPWLVMLACRNAKWLVTMGIVALISIPVAILLAIDDGEYHAGTLDISDGPAAIFRCVGGFILGMCIQRMTLRPGCRFTFTNWFGGAVIGTYILLLLCALPDLVLYPVFPLVVLCLAGNSGWLAMLCSNRPIYFLGLLSYAFYLVHVYFVVLRDQLESLLATLMPIWMALGGSTALVFVAVLGLSAGLYYYIEVPSRRYLRNFGIIPVAIVPVV